MRKGSHRLEFSIRYLFEYKSDYSETGVNDLIELCDDKIKLTEAMLKKCGEMSEAVNQLKWKIEQGE